MTVASAFTEVLAVLTHPFPPNHMEPLKVQTTRDYAKFKSLFGNRFVHPGHVRKLISSIEAANLMAVHPVIVNKDFYVIDGQHRIEAAKQLKLEVPYVIVDDADLATVQQLNSNARSWTLRDFCDSYAKLGNDHYIKLIDFSSHFDIPLSLAAGLLIEKADDGGHITTSLREGTFQITNYDNALDMMRRLRQIQPFSDGGAWRKREFLRALLSMYQRGMDHELFIEQLRKTGKRVQPEVSYRDYVFRLHDIYNHGLKKNRISLIPDEEAGPMMGANHLLS